MQHNYAVMLLYIITDTAAFAVVTPETQASELCKTKTIFCGSGMLPGSPPRQTVT